MKIPMIYWLASLLGLFVSVTVEADVEEHLLGVLTPAQAQAYADGLEPEEIELPNGESLAEYVARQERKERSGLVLRTLEPCVIVDTSLAVEKALSGYPLGLLLRGETRDLSSYGGSAEGCGIPNLEGEVFFSNRARALLLSVEIRDASESGSLAFGSTGSLVAFRPSEPTTASSLIVPLCDEENADPCADGDLVLLLEGQAEVTVAVHGYLEPVDNTRATAKLEETGAEAASKASIAPFWEKRTDNDDIYYTGGFVGIGTASPQWDLDIHGDTQIRSSFLQFYNNYPGYPEGFHQSRFQQWGRFSLLLLSEGNAFAIEKRESDTTRTIAFFDRDSENVGIGTKNPQTPLSLRGNRAGHAVGITQNQIGGGASMEFTTTDDNGLQATRVLLRGDGDDGGFEIYRGARGSEQITFKVQGTNGYVGIGTEQSPVPLTIRKSNSTRAVGITQYQVGGDATMELTTKDGIGRQATRVLLRGAADYADFEVYRGARGSEALMLKVEGTNGRLGLGTAEPHAGVHVFRENERAHLLAERGDGHFVGLYSGTGFSGLGFENTGAFSITPMTGIGGVASNRAFTVTPDSKVGIRTADPAEALEVDGNIKLSGSLISDGDICIGQCG